tara:strand:+ start:2590 stop:3456 length:867 start_codon:yes stop_codon:yes gene_type:complete
MATFNYIHPMGNPPFQDGDTPTGDEVEENWYLPLNAGPVSLEVSNGWLEEDNLAPNETFKKYHIQRGALSTSGMVGSTASVDFFWNVYQSVNTLYYIGALSGDREWLPENPAAIGIHPEDPPSALFQYYEHIPGANIEYYCPFDSAKVLLQWNIVWANDGYLEGQAAENIQDRVSKVQMFFTSQPGAGREQTLDGVGNRKCPPGFMDDDPGRHFPWGQPTLTNAMFTRSWSGHKLVTLSSKGWYSAGLRLLFAANIENNHVGEAFRVDGSTGQTRVYARSMRYIIFMR